MHGEIKNTFSVGKLEGKRLLGRPRCRWKDNITVEFKD
jgi:hypothetical protein